MFEETEIIVLEENTSVLFSPPPLSKIGIYKKKGWETLKGVGEGYSFVLKLK